MPAPTSRARAFICWPRAIGKLLAMFLAMVLALPPVSAQSGSVPGPAPSRLQIQVLSTVPLTEMAGTLSANRLQVRITDEWGMPVSGATVSFRLPEAGPGGVFLNGLSSEIALTDERGEAAILGFDWRKDAGVTFVHVIAAYKSIRAGAMVEVHLGRKVNAVPSAVGEAVPPAPQRKEDEVARAPIATQPAIPQTSEVPVPPLAPAAPAGEPANPVQPVLGQMASDTRPSMREVLLPVANRAPREETPTPPGPAYQSPMVRPKGKTPAQSADAGGDPASSAYVRTKAKSGKSGSKMIVLLLVAGAAAGGALAAGMGGNSGSSSNAGGNAAPVPVIRIGSPTITLSGGN